MRVDNTAAGLSILAACTTDVKQWYTQNGLQLNPDKSEALFMGMATQLKAVSSLTSVSVADVDLPVTDSMRVIGVTVDPIVAWLSITTRRAITTRVRSTTYAIYWRWT